ncbi:unnamed protein product [Pieris macdunnoughi]|uniref:Uncharacterized protein n=1 Tax=Pieris macdunnoughi TaxID=345717 RepID=A0A821VIL6_9NEOP|nr:unnamed protein product [Pieris macdunnoughi]
MWDSLLYIIITPRRHQQLLEAEHDNSVALSASCHTISHRNHSLLWPRMMWNRPWQSGFTHIGHFAVSCCAGTVLARMPTHSFFWTNEPLFPRGLCGCGIDLVLFLRRMTASQNHWRLSHVAVRACNCNSHNVESSVLAM